MPDISNVHVDAPLTNLSVARIQAADSFISKEVFPIVPVKKKSDKYFVFDKGDFNRLEMKRGAPGRKAPSVMFNLSDDSYSCDKYHVRNPTPEEIQVNADAPLDLKNRNATQWMTLQMLLQMEALFATAFWGPTIWTTDWDGVSSSPSTGEVLQWDQSGSSPIGNVQSLKFAVEASSTVQEGKWVLAVGSRVHKVLMTHTELVGRLTGASETTGALVRKQLAALLDVDQYIVGRSRINTAARGQTDSYSAQLTDNDLLLARVPANPQALEVESPGYIMGWTGMPGASQMGTRIRRYDNQEEETHYVEGAMWVDMKLTSADCGAYIDAAVASDA